MKWLDSIKSWAGRIRCYTTCKAMYLRNFWFHVGSISWSIYHFKLPARKTVTAQFLQDICIKLTPPINSQPETSNQRANLLRAYVKNGRAEENSEDNPTISIFLKKLQIEELIKTHNLAQHIKFSYNHTKDGDVLCITIMNLNVKGNFSGDFHSFAHVSLINNIFYHDVEIHIIGASYSEDNEIYNNKFLGNFCYNIFNTKKIYFKRNKALKKFNIFHRLDFKNWEECLKPLTATPSDTKLTSINIMLASNHINICHICDQSASPVTNFHIDNIRLQGGNTFNRLTMQTQYNILTEDEQKANIEQISFDANDRITPTKRENKSTIYAYMNYFTKLHKESLEKKHILSTTNYARQVKRIDLMLMSRWQDKIVIRWGEYASNGGTSWAKALRMLFYFQFTLAFITYYLFAGYDLDPGRECSIPDMPCPYIEGGWGAPFWALIAWFMNPASILPFIPITMKSWPIYFLFFFQKLFSALFYYEIVKALRRFSK